MAFLMRRETEWKYHEAALCKRGGVYGVEREIVLSGEVAGPRRRPAHAQAVPAFKASLSGGLQRGSGASWDCPIHTFKSPALDDVGTLRNRIVAGCGTIRKFPGIHQRIRMSMQRRVDVCTLCCLSLLVLKLRKKRQSTVASRRFGNCVCIAETSLCDIAKVSIHIVGLATSCKPGRHEKRHHRANARLPCNGSPHATGLEYDSRSYLRACTCLKEREYYVKGRRFLGGRDSYVRPAAQDSLSNAKARSVLAAQVSVIQTPVTGTSRPTLRDSQNPLAKWLERNFSYHSPTQSCRLGEWRTRGDSLFADGQLVRPADELVLADQNLLGQLTSPTRAAARLLCIGGFEWRLVPSACDVRQLGDTGVGSVRWPAASAIFGFEEPVAGSSNSSPHIGLVDRDGCPTPCCLNVQIMALIGQVIQTLRTSLRSGMEELRAQCQESRERYGRHQHALLAPHRAYAQDVQCFRRNTVLCKLDPQQKGRSSASSRSNEYPGIVSGGRGRRAPRRSDPGWRPGAGVLVFLAVGCMWVPAFRRPLKCCTLHGPHTRRGSARPNKIRPFTLPPPLTQATYTNRPVGVNWSVTLLPFPLLYLHSP
ncbi:hypothetical protein PR048_014876 [Dryococelus australis]|uniref:Uncharacterized protein n=1 Tax=Dryococelus australis TaxID=614101 RepID=A0ABQ9HFD6_9NEOP|nr:hypothetical protein PR048_014876 [Dryococelus australis]